MQIYSIYDKEFKRYGKVLEGYATEDLMEGLKKTPVTEGVVYTAEDPDLQALPFAKIAADQIYGGMPVQLGWCNGKNRKLNCLEYHRDSEINFGTSDFILLLGKQEEIDEDWMFDTENVKAFLVPAGVLVEVYATTLHYAPCSKELGDPFQVLVILPKGTNTDKPEYTPVCHEDKLMTARNKWLLAHPDSDEAKGGAVVGLKGVNTEL
ncbi:MAG: DUF4867 family protein [Lachnospiraceae bacterium]|nr:DUF4867 family protein [Lachnospiraceae bacterium]